MRRFNLLKIEETYNRFSTSLFIWDLSKKRNINPSESLVFNGNKLKTDFDHFISIIKPLYKPKEKEVLNFKDC